MTILFMEQNLCMATDSLSTNMSFEKRNGTLGMHDIDLDINPCSAEPWYTLPLQTV